MAKTLKKWQGWALFLGSMVVVFLLGLLVSSLMERRAEVASVFNNKRTVFEDSTHCSQTLYHLSHQGSSLQTTSLIK